MLDLTSVVMGPFATQILGDLGADVITVEPPRGESNRSMGPGPLPQLSGQYRLIVGNPSAAEFGHPIMTIPWDIE